MLQASTTRRGPTNQSRANAVQPAHCYATVASWRRAWHTPDTSSIRSEVCAGTRVASPAAFMDGATAMTCACARHHQHDIFHNLCCHS